jgi:hypothetical protein
MNIKKKAPLKAGLYNFFSRPTKCTLSSLVSDFISKVKHVFGYRFSGYRLGFPQNQLDVWFCALELDLDCERFFKDTIYIRIATFLKPGSFN